jgi:hypothetical protein
MKKNVLYGYFILDLNYFTSRAGAILSFTHFGIVFPYPGLGRMPPGGRKGTNLLFFKQLPIAHPAALLLLLCGITVP